jgi:HPt (histidine-containing phosphotransfer) domain-containing protein
MQSNSQDLARRAMHTLKGLAATVGARHLSLVAAQLEKTLKADVAQSEHAAMLAQLQQAIDALSAKLTPLLGSYKATAGNTATSDAAKPMNRAQFQCDLDVLCKLLEDANMLALTAHTAIQNNYGAQLGTDFEPLNQAMLQFDFVSARRACMALLAKHCG